MEWFMGETENITQIIMVATIIIVSLHLMFTRKQEEKQRKKNDRLREDIVKIIEELQHEHRIAETEEQREKLAGQIRSIIKAAYNYYRKDISKNG